MADDGNSDLDYDGELKKHNARQKAQMEFNRKYSNIPGRVSKRT